MSDWCDRVAVLAGPIYARCVYRGRLLGYLIRPGESVKIYEVCVPCGRFGVGGTHAHTNPVTMVLVHSCLYNTKRPAPNWLYTDGAAKQPRRRSGCRIQRPPSCYLLCTETWHGSPPTNQASLWLLFGARCMQTVCLSGRHSHELLADSSKTLPPSCSLLCTGTWHGSPPTN